MSAMSDRRLSTVSLFTGAGGLDVGLEHEGGFDLLACLELEPQFCETLRLNRDDGRFGTPETRVLEADLHTYDPYELMDLLAMKPGELDLLVGGPPCQAFSTAGRRRTLSDPRGQLIFDYLRFVDAFKPRYFLMENVRGLLSAGVKHRPIAERPDKGGAPLLIQEQPGSVVQTWLDDLRKIDGGAYRVDVFEVNAVNYGAPQLRERVLFIGTREGHLINFPEPTHGPTDAAPHRRPFASLADALEGFHEDNPVLMDFSPRKKSYLSQVPPGGNWRMLPPEVAQESMGRAYFAKGGRSGWWRRLSWDLPCPTITTLPNHSSTSMCHPFELRVLSVGECARIQEFPDGWTFVGTPAQQMKQVGNAVPARLGQVAGQVVRYHASHPAEDGADLPPYRRIYLRSHVRTRQWWKDGHAFVWDGVGGTAEYGQRRSSGAPTLFDVDVEGERVSAQGFYRGIKKRRVYDPDMVEGWFSQVSQNRVNAIAEAMEQYISANLPGVIRSKSKLGDYRTSPYVLMATAGALRLEDLQELSKFLIDIKLYMGLETSFGKSIEKIVMQHFPLATDAAARWGEPVEKVEEFASYAGLSNEEKSAKRVDSVWREIDSSCVQGKRRHLMTIKSGVQTINDTQVSGMFNAIRDNNQKWLESSKSRYGVDGIDVVIGLTYGTDWATNNKENQILRFVK
jgi:DNA (cytosine-5)-methyltransferase 1